MKPTTILQKLQLLRPPKREDVDWDHCLPVEVLEQIFGYLLDERDACPTRVMFIRGTFQPTLRAAALVCRGWHDVVTKHLYNEIYLSSTKALELLTDTLVKYKYLRPLVHHFHFSSKVYASGNAQMLYTAMDIYSLRKIHEICPNLKLLVKAKPWMKALPADDDLAFRALKFDRAQIDKLTHLELAMPNGAIFGGRMGFSSSIEFPALQELYITESWRNYYDDTDLNTPQWFRMPQLRRLSLLGVKVHKWQTLTFPEHSPLINTIEFLKGDYENVTNFFDPLTSPLLPYRKTLESLTITAKQVTEVTFPKTFRWIELLDPYIQSESKWSLAFLENLVELCLPFRSFARIEITSYPPHLKELVLSGYLWELFEEDTDDIKCGGDNLEKLVKVRQAGRYLRELKRIRVLVRDVETRRSYVQLRDQLPGVELKLGTGRLYDLSLEDNFKKRNENVYTNSSHTKADDAHHD
ncbi:uncharacterized protein FOMMEDRAFT_31263 [Fomitiporia mediterranea MF3/22]|uniref:uncharacterized protein n=1 Tax=Fomitiporia mediterranea (strain MF3/22) TaxID=694068 RepID=UPI0004408AEA|nr:uncharacterized protein FOMMEDRAFT_31263 [Fomitiporia mediterranea MF3/22]EJC99154.1 hypothetical protein FOMMEDRAFT_31263 [Fomitiporia mediterranea MF3/22]